MTGFVAQELRRNRRNQRIFVFSILAVALAIPLVALPYLLECFRGPFPMTLEEITRLQSSGDAPHRFVTVDLSAHDFDPNYYYIEKGNDHHRDHYFFLHLSDQRFLIIKSSDDHPPAVLEGSLSNLSEDVTSKVIPGTHRIVSGTPLPVMLDDAPYREPMASIFAFSGILAAIAIFQLLRDARQFKDPKQNRTLRQLTLIGDPELIAVAIDAEVQEGITLFGKVQLTRSWIIRRNTFTTDLFFLGNAVWIYRHDPGFKQDQLSVGKAPAIIIIDSRGSRTIFQTTPSHADDILRQIAANVPWAYVGFDQALMDEWTHHQADFLQECAARKANWMPPASPPPLPPTA